MYEHKAFVSMGVLYESKCMQCHHLLQFLSMYRHASITSLVLNACGFAQDKLSSCVLHVWYVQWSVSCVLKCGLHDGL